MADEQIVFTDEDKQNKTEDEQNQLLATKEEEAKKTRFEQRKDEKQKEIDRLTWESKSLLENIETLKSTQDTLKKETQEVQELNKLEGDVLIAEKKKWYGDAYLDNLVETSPEKSNEVARYRRNRDRAVDRDIIRKENASRGEKTTFETEKEKDASEARKEFEFMNNPNDPLFKETERVWNEKQLYRSPYGLTTAAQIVAKKKNIVPKNDTTLSEMSVETTQASRREKGNKVTLTEVERLYSHKIFKHLGSDAKAEAKFLEAKKRKIERKTLGL